MVDVGPSFPADALPESSVNIQTEVYDSDILEIEKVLTVLNAKQGENHHLEGFRQEILERFANIGFKVDVKVFTTTEEGLYSFQIDIIDKYDKAEFDLDRQVAQVTRDMLELGEGGVIRTSKFKTDEKPKKDDKPKD